MCNEMLKALLLGNILPYEGRNHKTPKILELYEQITKERDHFEETMSRSECSRFDNYHALINARNGLECDEEYLDILVIGISIGMELVEHRQQLLQK